MSEEFEQVGPIETWVRERCRWCLGRCGAGNWFMDNDVCECEPDCDDTERPRDDRVLFAAARLLDEEFEALPRRKPNARASR